MRHHARLRIELRHAADVFLIPLGAGIGQDAAHRIPGGMIEDA
jgi:hypothetical protein